jgi:hypothetical protein
MPCARSCWASTTTTAGPSPPPPRGDRWSWVFESVSEESQRQHEGFYDTLDLLLRIEN